MSSLQRILLLSALLILMSSSSVMVMFYVVNLSHEQSELQHIVKLELEAKSNDMLSTLQNLRDDLYFLASLTEQMYKYGDEQPWKGKISHHFSAFMSAHKEILKIRLMHEDHLGWEILRINHFSNDVSVVPDTRLQKKGHRPYMQAAQQLQQGEVYYSSMNLNHDQGQISLPHTPVMRILTPFFVDGKKKGFVSISLRVQFLFEMLKLSNFANGDSYLLNRQGDILFGPNPDLSFAFEFGQSQKLQQILPSLDPLFHESAPSQGDLSLSNHQHVFYTKVFFNPGDLSRYFVLLKVYSLSDHAVHELQLTILMQFLVYIALIVIVMACAFYFAKKITAPLQGMQCFSQSLMKKNVAEMLLACSQQAAQKDQKEFLSMIYTMRALCQNIVNYEQKILEREGRIELIQQLEKLHTQRELQMIALKKEVNGLYQKCYGVEKYSIDHMLGLIEKEPMCLCKEGLCVKSLLRKKSDHDES